MLLLLFPERYHAEIITSPTQARHTLSYVLNNWRKHGEDRGEKVKAWRIDWFSSAAMFPDFAEYGADDAMLWRGPPSYEPLFSLAETARTSHWRASATRP